MDIPLKTSIEARQKKKYYWDWLSKESKTNYPPNYLRHKEAI